MEEDIKQCVEVLRAGGIILYPTDTIWGIGCDATNKQAVEKVYQLKQRFDNQKMLVLVHNDAMVERYVDDAPEVAFQLIECAEKPLTIIFENAKNLAENILGDNRSIGIRVTKEAFSQKLIERFRKPIVSTSANIHNQPSPAIFSQIAKEIVDGVDYVVKYRQDDKKEQKPSSLMIIKPSGEFKILR
jgi:L-threonylcarbamoyladenylate synthase